ncbi:sugar phosphate isomerase/epimerase family protein [Thermomonospora cellulosilytica]|uniref:Sugar phosphate isomerase/epimerase n=1 Tax=Thermomonospora cellulosilytica TaxID=1411118 RepID=A0A7W3N0T5_9ACTN|nr:sugar phosphate isomerase/epimerase family protein [Thermomonospora cellulosilytica]MBA9005454.1 sugar phosphate isomerase/epimerase [Thermomonospora cellulosilytica]
MSHHHEHEEALRRGLGLNRRQFLAATTGIAAATALPLATAGPARADGRLVPPGKRGIILYTVRDAISRDPLTTDLPSGFRRVFEELARIGYKQVEFAGYRQHANAEGGANLETVEGARMLRRWLDDNGLEAEGNHGFIPGSWPLSAADLDRFKQALEIAGILGLGHMGTGGDPTGSAYKADWDVAAEKWNRLGEIATAAGIKLYTHNHDVAYSFLLDSGPLDAQGRPTRSSGLRRLEYFLSITDPAHVYLEMDIFWAHVARFKYHTFTAPDGSVQRAVFDPLAVVQAQPIRFPLFHAKDGRSNPASGNGYDMVPFGTGDIDYARFFSQMGAKGYHNPMYEQDNAPGGSANPGQSLQYAELSFKNLAALRG